jgi:hypothetical protein
MTDASERRTNHALRRRIDQLIRHVRESRAHIVERGLDAVHEQRRARAGEPGADGVDGAGQRRDPPG